MAEEYIFYSSLALSGMGCLALILFLLFHLKYHKMNSLSTNLLANIFNKTFNVLDPYSERGKVIHKLLSLLPVFSALFILFFLIFLYDLFLIFFITIVGLNLMLIDASSEVYPSANIFVKAADVKADLGVGDAKVFQILKNAMPRLSNYHLTLSIFFFIFAFTIGYIWSSLVWLFSYLVNLILEISAMTGIFAYVVAVLIFALILTTIQILANTVKNKFLMSITELSGFGE